MASIGDTEGALQLLSAQLELERSRRIEEDQSWEKVESRRIKEDQFWEDTRKWAIDNGHAFLASEIDLFQNGITLRPTQDSEDAQVGVSHQTEAVTAQGPHFDELSLTILVKDEAAGVYSAPISMRGVPIEKISETSPYWEKNWLKLEKVIPDAEKTQRENAEDLAAKKNVAENLINATKQERENSEKQVRKAESCLHNSEIHYKNMVSLVAWAKDLEVHPNQIVGKKHIDSLGLLSGHGINMLKLGIEKVEPVRKEFGIECSAIDLLRGIFYQAVRNTQSEKSAVAKKWWIKVFLKDLRRPPTRWNPAIPTIEQYCAKYKEYELSMSSEDRHLKRLASIDDDTEIQSPKKAKTRDGVSEILDEKEPFGDFDDEIPDSDDEGSIIEQDGNGPAREGIDMTAEAGTPTLTISPVTMPSIGPTSTKQTSSSRKPAPARPNPIEQPARQSAPQVQGRGEDKLIKFKEAICSDKGLVLDGSEVPRYGLRWDKKKRAWLPYAGEDLDEDEKWLYVKIYQLKSILHALNDPRVVFERTDDKPLALEFQSYPEKQAFMADLVARFKENSIFSVKPTCCKKKADFKTAWEAATKD